MSLRCPDCHGSGRVMMRGFMCGPATSLVGNAEIACGQCRGAGAVPDSYPDWKVAAEELKTARLSKGISGREMAARLRVSAVVMSDAEHARIDPRPLLLKLRAS